FAVAEPVPPLLEQAAPRNDRRDENDEPEIGQDRRSVPGLERAHGEENLQAGVDQQRISNVVAYLPAPIQLAGGAFPRAFAAQRLVHAHLPCSPESGLSHLGPPLSSPVTLSRGRHA